MLWLVVLAGGCHGSPATSRQPAPAPITQSHLSVTGTSRADDLFTQPDAIFPETTTAVDAERADGQATQPNMVRPESTAVDAERATGEIPPHFAEGDVLFHVMNDTGVDVFVNDNLPLAFAQRDKYVDVYHDCGTDCPICACKECPIEPPRYRRIAHRRSWVYGWDRIMYIEQRCDGPCPCARQIVARPGTYTVAIHGKGGSNPPRTVKRSLFDPRPEKRPEERYVDCEATATFVLKPGAHVDLKFTCQR